MQKHKVEVKLQYCKFVGYIEILGWFRTLREKQEKVFSTSSLESKLLLVMQTTGQIFFVSTLYS